MKCKIAAVLILLLALTPALLGEDKSAMAPNASFDKMKTLDGAWVAPCSKAVKSIRPLPGS